jgi:hypothetical protein
LIPVPVIAVFTKYDFLVSRLERSTTSAGDAKKEADSIVKKACIEPLETAAGMKVPNMAISSKSCMNHGPVRVIQKHCLL